MPINLQNQEQRPTITQARVRGFAINTDTTTAFITVVFGFLSGGNFTAVREETYMFTAETTPTFGQFVNAVPQVRDLRDALETHIVALGRVPGTKI